MDNNANMSGSHDSAIEKTSHFDPNENIEPNNSDDSADSYNKEMVNLEKLLTNKQITKGEKRRIQNRRNVLKAKIRDKLENRKNVEAISALRKEFKKNKVFLDRNFEYKEQITVLREE